MLDSLSPETLFLDRYLKRQGYQTWGWVIYRTTYNNNDEDWNYLKKALTEEVRGNVQYDETPDVSKSLNESLRLTFFEDRSKFNNASKDQLRAHFQEWALHAYYTENPQRITLHDQQKVPLHVFYTENPQKIQEHFHLDPALAPRYRYFIQIDEESLWSLLHEPNCEMWEGLKLTGHVNFVDGWWKSLQEQYAMSGDPKIKEEIDSQLEEGYEPVEGCVEENTGWMMLHRFGLHLNLYLDAPATSEFRSGWPVWYERPDSYNK